MNKKAAFLPLFVIVTLVILSLLAYTISITKLSRNDKIGMSSLSIIKSYDEADKDIFFLEQSLKLSSDKIVSQLYANGGYLENNNCKKLRSSSAYVLIDSSCGSFDIDSNFINGLNPELETYLKNYQSTYEEFNYADLFGDKFFKVFNLVPDAPTVSERGSIFRTVSNNAVQNSKIIKTELKDDLLLVSFSDISLKIENSLQSSYVIHPKIAIKNPNLDFFNTVYKKVAINCIQKKPEDCALSLSNDFEAKTSIQGNIIFVDISVDSNVLKFAVDVSSRLPNVNINSKINQV